MKYLKRIGKIIFCLAMIISSITIIHGENESYIIDDAYVSNFNGQESNNYASSETLILGKLRHVYMRFDLKEFNSEDDAQYILKGTWAKGTRSKVVVTQSSEYLRADENNDSEVKFTQDNITFNNRPLDVGELNISQDWNEEALEIDLTSFIKGEIAKGMETACIHLTTQDVEDTSKSAVEIYSSRSQNKPYLDVVSDQVEEPVGYLNNVIDDAYVSNMSGNEDKNYATSNTLIFGKLRHVYVRLDLSKIDEASEKITFKGTYAKGTKATVVVSEASDYLRASDSENSTELWTQENITYNNRPLDVGDFKLEQEWKSSQVNLELDLTEFLKQKKQAGNDTISLHITTTSVENESIGAVEIYSSRSETGKPKLVISSLNDEKPVELLRDISADNYYNNGKLIQKVIKIKDAAGNYLKVSDDTTVTTTTQSEEASLFGLHVYQYDEFTRESYGATKTTYALEELNSGKYLTIQNYFDADDEDKSYYNKVGNKYIIKATADDVNWNERFNIEYYPESKYYTISSHLNANRDGSGATSSLYLEDNVLKSGNNDDLVKYYFEVVSNEDRLTVIQDVTGNSVKLSWKPVNGDTNASNYKIDGASVNYDQESDFLTATITDLSVGLHNFNVNYQDQNDTVVVRIFNHLSLVHSQEQLDQMKEHILNKEEPWYSDYQRLLTQVPNHMSDSTYEIKVHEGVGRGDPEGHGNITDYEQSANAAYFNALRWVITGEDCYADTAVNILNSWANTLKIVDGRDRILGAAISTYRLNNAAEIIKYYNGGYKGYSDEDFKQYQAMLLNVIYPVIQDLGTPMIANGNWDTAAMIAMISIGAVCDNTEIYERATYLYQDIHTNGSIAVYVSDWGQSVESYRDQAHAQLGISYLAEVCEVAKKQGQDLYSLYNNRLAKAFNWAAQYNLYNTDNLKMEPLVDVYGRNNWSIIDQEKINRGELRAVYELPLAHYSNVEGVDVTWMKKAAEAMRSQGYVNNDHLNFGTLTTYNGEETIKPEPFFQLRTRLEPWYQRTWSAAYEYGEVTDNIPETLTSYFDVVDNGELVASSKKATAPYYQLESMDDGTYAIRCTTTNTYLSVKEEQVNGMNVIKADAKEVGANEKFILKGTGISFFYFESPTFDNRIVYVDVENENDPKNAKLTMRLGNRITESISGVTNYERFILMYNTKDVALKNIDLADTTDLEALVNQVSKITNNNQYTEASYKLLMEALADAKQGIIDAQYGRIDATQVKALYDALNNALNNLVLINDNDIVDNDDTNNDGAVNGNTDKTGDVDSVKTGDEDTIYVMLSAVVISFIMLSKLKRKWGEQN